MCSENHGAGTRQRFEGFDRRHQLHAIVRGGTFGAIELLLVVAVAKDRAPTAGARISAAGAVRKNVNAIGHAARGDNVLATNRASRASRRRWQRLYGETSTRSATASCRT